MEYLFIYGIFRDVASKFLAKSYFCDPAYIIGEMYKVNEFYPGYVSKSCDNKVFGEVYLIDESILPELDEYEGEEYTRKKIWTSLGFEAWVYEYNFDITSFEKVESNDWLLR